MKILRALLVNIILLILLSIALFPVAWVLGASLRPGEGLFSTRLFPESITLKNYYLLLKETNFLRWVNNTLIICGASSFLSVTAALFAGYAFSRFRFWGRKWGLAAMILVQMFPAAMALVALYRLLLILGNVTGGVVGLNTFSGLILIYVGGGIPFNAWLIKGYIDNIPKDLEESAYIDGATTFQTFWKIVLPLLGPILAVVAIFSFIGPYADFIFPSVLLTGEDKFTLAVGMRSFISNNFNLRWTQFAAASILGALPILVIFLSLQKFLVEGLTKGALKG